MRCFLFSSITEKIRRRDGFRRSFLNPPVFDETGYHGPVDITIKSGFKDLDVLEKELAKYDLGIKEEIREIQCLVLTEKSGDKI